eukprot:NODE_2753_length_546_cov_39.434608_g2369_i0.p1 GENE.NODE_2753_length_546_cov_39.434608_g2369_i0~~NODE_2753_length_546_cov_39.434608_g2369_i0.p1  ORF type:complete len:54 (+),score=17.54 NODE_2753_length_546_cov_39.434608_g2369_i0:26-163(+)
MGGFWRLYDLKANGILCRIHEAFSPDLFNKLDQRKIGADEKEYGI